MNTGKAQIMWVSDRGAGKIRTFLVSPYILRVFFIVIAFCVFSVPFLGKGVIMLEERVTDLEARKQNLQAEILTLKTIRRSLKAFEEKETSLRSYFGMEKYRSLDRLLDDSSRADFEFLGTGGYLGPEEGADYQKKTKRPSKAPFKKNLQEKLQRLGKNYDALNRLMLIREEAWNNTPSIVPLALENPRISSAFGWRSNPFTAKREFHAGIDIIGPKGTKVIAPSGGTVSTVGYDRWLGRYVVLKHTDETKTIYGHLDRITVREGMAVNRGDHLGLMGNTGLSTSRHLHYGVIVNNRAVDPMQFILDMAG